MDTTLWILLLLASVMGGITWHAHRLGNEKRDVSMLGSIAALLAIGAAAAVVF